MRVLLTRPQAEAERSAAGLRALGHEAIFAPVMVIAPLAFAVPSRAFDAVVITSAHAVAGLTAEHMRRLASLPVFATGIASSRAAQSASFLKVRAGAGGETELAQLAQAHLPRGARALYLAGRERTGGLTALLEAAGLRCDLIETYDAAAAAALPAAAAEALRAGDLGAVLHYSARSAAILFCLCEAAGLAAPLETRRHLCLSGEIAAALPAAVRRRAHIAAQPDETSLFALLSQI